MKKIPEQAIQKKLFYFFKKKNEQKMVSYEEEEEEHNLFEAVDAKLKQVMRAHRKFPFSYVLRILRNVFNGDELVEMDLEKPGTFDHLYDEDDMSYVGRLNHLYLLLDAAMKGYDLSTQKKIVDLEDEVTGRKAKREREEQEQKEWTDKLKFYDDLSKKAEQLYPGDEEKDYLVKLCREKFLQSDGKDQTPMEVRRREFKVIKLF